MSPLRRVKTKIGDLLLQKGLIKPEQLQEALSLQHTTHKDKTVGQILIDLGYITKEALYSILAIQSGYPYIAINNCVIEPKVLALFPEALAKKYLVLPIDKIEDIFTVAMVNPLDRAAIQEIEELTRQNVKVFLTTPAELQEAFAKYYGQKH